MMRTILNFLILFTLISIISCYDLNSIEEIVTFIVEEDSIGYYGNILARFPSADLNNDGFTDFINPYFLNNEDGYQLQYFMGSANPDSIPDFTLTVPWLLNLGIPSYAGDLNNDGWNDLLVPLIDYDSQYIYVFLGSQELIPNFEDPDLYISNGDIEMGWLGRNTGADFNGDGFDDIIASGSGPAMTYNGIVEVFFGSDELDPWHDFIIVGDFYEELGKYTFYGDINGDGFDDLITSRAVECFIRYQYEIYLGSEDFNEICDYVIDDGFSGSLTESFADGDLNGDGLSDIVICAESTLNIYLGNISNNFSLDYIIDTGEILNNAFYCDFNNDGIDDIVLTCRGNIGQIYFGSEDFDVETDIFFSNDDNNDYFGEYGCNLGDFNGDGNNDILLSEELLGNTATVYTDENLVSYSSPKFDVIKYKINHYPNPFNPSATIFYSITQHGDINLSIYNLKGQRMRTLINGYMESGNHSIAWDGTNDKGYPVESGIYLYRLEINGRTQAVSKMVLVK